MQAADPIKVISFYLPPGVGSKDANSSTTLPMAFTDLDGHFSAKPMLYQQVYNAPDFSQVPSGGSWIVSIALRDNCEDVDSATRVDTEIFLSTSLRRADQLSTQFSENTGPDALRVYGPTNYLLGGFFHNCVFSGVGNDYFMNLATPFFYNPAKGNLLLEMRSRTARAGRPENRQSALVDAQDVFGDGVSRIAASSLTNSTAEIMDTVGAVTRFVFVPTPGLHITQETNTWIVSWPYVPDPFRLQVADTLGSTAVWKDQAGPFPVVEGGYKVATFPAALLKKKQYFRLFYNSPQPGISGAALAPASPNSTLAP